MYMLLKQDSHKTVGERWCHVERAREERDSAIRLRYCEIASTETCYTLKCTKSSASHRTINYQNILLSPYIYSS